MRPQNDKSFNPKAGQRQARAFVLTTAAEISRMERSKTSSLTTRRDVGRFVVLLTGGKAGIPHLGRLIIRFSTIHAGLRDA